MNRRSFLGFLAFAPLAVPAVAAVRGMPRPYLTGSGVMGSDFPIIGRGGEVVFTPTRESIRRITIKAVTKNLDEAHRQIMLMPRLRPVADVVGASRPYATRRYPRLMETSQ